MSEIGEENAGFRGQCKPTVPSIQPHSRIVLGRERGEGHREVLGIKNSVNQWLIII